MYTLAQGNKNRSFLGLQYTLHYNYSVYLSTRGMSKVATDCLRVFIECQRNYYIRANLWTVQGWHSRQAQDPLAK